MAWGESSTTQVEGDGRQAAAPTSPLSAATVKAAVGAEPFLQGGGPGPGLPLQLLRPAAQQESTGVRQGQAGS